MADIYREPPEYSRHKELSGAAQSRPGDSLHVEETLPYFSPAGDRGVVVTLATEIGEPARARVARLDSAIAGAAFDGVVEVIPAYTTLLVVYDPLVTGYDVLVAAIRPLALCAMADGACAPDGRRWRIPVCYGGACGTDLIRIAERLGCTPDDVITAHSGTTYTVHMLGFLPGFAYLAGLPSHLAMPRRATPRQRVLVGSVAVGGAQTAIWPIDGPCGWHIIGRTPCRTFEREPIPGSFLKSGDRITFDVIDPGMFAALESAAARGERIVRVAA